MEKIINLTLHSATEDQLKEGVENYRDMEMLKRVLTFIDIPDRKYLQYVADRLTSIAKLGGYKKAMIGGAVYFMPVLEKALLEAGITVCYAFSKRVCEETQLPDGSVEKKYIFKHLGFYEVKPHEHC